MIRWRRLLDHWQLKLLSVAFAVGLWLFVVSEDKVETVFAAPIELREIPMGLEIARMETETVEVRVRGLRSIVSRVRDRDLRVPLDLKGVQPGETVLRVVPEKIGVPRGVEVLRVTPSRIRVVLRPVGSAGPGPPDAAGPGA
ncbi:MAG: hypothetical protein HYY19_06130 [Candidatus Rokubacteria bacterium]|nr:hypothetical protein [Candidatus Rokubacteria bacterium]